MSAERCEPAAVADELVAALAAVLEEQREQTTLLRRLVYLGLMGSSPWMHVTPDNEREYGAAAQRLVDVVREDFPAFVDEIVEAHRRDAFATSSDSSVDEVDGQRDREQSGLHDDSLTHPGQRECVERGDQP